jgi:hypothetical protein
VNRLGSALRTGLLYLTPSGRQRARRLREAETDAIIAAKRLEIAEMLAGIGAHHLSLADLTRQRLTAGHPRLAHSGHDVIDSLARAIGSEIDGFALQRRREVHRR